MNHCSAVKAHLLLAKRSQSEAWPGGGGRWSFYPSLRVPLLGTDTARRGFLKYLFKREGANDWEQIYHPLQLASEASVIS